MTFTETLYVAHYLGHSRNTEDQLLTRDVLNDEGEFRPLPEIVQVCTDNNLSAVLYDRNETRKGHVSANGSWVLE